MATSRNTSPPRVDTLEEAQHIIKRQAYDLKLLSSDAKVKDQQLQILKAKFKEIEATSQEFQNQIYILEKSLITTEEHSKIQAELNLNQITKLSLANDTLSQTNQDLQHRIKTLEYQQKQSKEGLGEVLQEIHELRIRSNKSQQAILDTRDILYKKQKELADAEMALLNTRNENEELRKRVEELRARLIEISGENDGLRRTVKGYDREEEIHTRTSEELVVLRKAYNKEQAEYSALRHSHDLLKLKNEKEQKEYSAMKQNHQVLKSKYEKEQAEYSAMKHSHELLKLKYDDLKHEYDSKVIEGDQNESYLTSMDMKVESQNKQLDKYKSIIQQRDNEIAKMRKEIIEAGELMEQREETLEASIRRAITLLDEQEVEIDYEGDAALIYNETIHELMNKIVQTNKVVKDAAERQEVCEEEYKYLEKELADLAGEKEELMGQYEELVQNYEALETRYKELEEFSVNEKQELHAKFDEEIEKMADLLNNAEQKAQEVLQGKEQEILELLEEREKMSEHFAGQEHGIKDYKDKFLALAEESTLQKARIEKISYVLATFLKIFVNLLVRFKALANHKEFLNNYFWQYRSLKQKLIELNLIDSELGALQMRTVDSPVSKFRRAGTIVRTLIRLRKLSRKNKDDNVDPAEVAFNMKSVPEALRRFVCGLFRHDRLGIENEVVPKLEGILNEFDGLNENVVVSKMLANITNLKSDNQVLSDWAQQLKFKEVGDEELQINFEINMDMNEKLEILTEKLMIAEEHIRTQGSEAGARIKDLMNQLEEVKAQSEAYRKSNESIVEEFDRLKEEVSELLRWIQQRGEDIYTQNGEPGEAVETHEREEEEQEQAMLQERINSLHSNMLEVRRRNSKLQKQIGEQRFKTSEQSREMIELPTDQENIDIEHFDTPGFNTSINSLRTIGKIIKASAKKLDMM